MAVDTKPAEQEPDKAKTVVGPNMAFLVFLILVLLLASDK